MNAQPLQQAAVGATTGRTRRLEAILVSGEDEFIIELGPVLGDRYRVNTVENLAAIPEPGAGGVPLLLIDGDGVGPEATTHSQARLRGNPTIVITADPSVWPAANGDIVAVVSRTDVAGPRMAEALRAAEARLRATAASTAAPQPEAAGSGRNAKPLLLIAAALAFIALAAAGGWLLRRSQRAAMPVASTAALSTRVVPATGAAAPVAKPATAPAAAPAPQSVFELLSAARVALHDQKLLPHDPPRGDSAVELYAQVLIQDPHNAEAADGVRRLFSAGRPVIESDIAAGRLDEAAQLLTSFHAAGADANVLHQLDAAVAAARPRWLATRAREAIRTENLPLAQQLIDQLGAGGDSGAVADLNRDLDAKKTEIQLRGMAATVRAAISAGSLTEPAGDSALSRLQAMRNVNRNHPLTLSAQHDLQVALLARSQDASRQGQFDAAQRALAAAADIASSPEVNAAKRELQADMNQAAQRAAAAASAAAAARAQAHAAGATAAAVPSAAPARPAVQQMLAARTRGPLDVEYPPRALQAGIKGFVVVEFTLHPDGHAAEAAAVESVPKGLFDVAAVNAVLGGRFDTTGLVDGQSRRARIRINFDPK